jgi:hypothetical protein
MAALQLLANEGILHYLAGYVPRLIWIFAALKLVGLPVVAHPLV